MIQGRPYGCFPKSGVPLLGAPIEITIFLHRCIREAEHPEKCKVSCYTRSMPGQVNREPEQLLPFRYGGMKRLTQKDWP